ncbi:MAG: MBL fold metallo-hydrolase [Thermoanaerobaculaceae bacterium]
MTHRPHLLAVLTLVGVHAAIAADPAARITVLYDNTSARPGLEAKWGFACLVEAHGRTVLFDTGGDSAVLRRNIEQLKVDPRRVEAVVISHFHGDHTGGASGSGVPRGTRVYTPRSFARHPEAMQSLTGAGLVPVAIEEATSLGEGLALMAPLPFPGGRRLPSGAPLGDAWETALVVDTPRGLVVVVGCSHPGILAMIEQVRTQSGSNVYMVVGGFHLMEKSRAAVTGIATAMKAAGVAWAGPTHCTGEEAIDVFREVYGDHFVRAGAGAVIEVAAVPHAGG